MNILSKPAAPAGLPARSRGFKWLRRIHAWVGLWSAALGLLFGVSGLLLNHRDIMKIPAAKMHKSEIELALPDPRPEDAKALAKWLQVQLHIDREPSRIVVEKEKTVPWSNQTIRQPGQWRIDFHGPKRSVSTEYWLGNAFVSVKSQTANAPAFLTRLHKGIGMGPAWILLADTLAGGMAFLSLTGLWLWTRLHGPRMLMAGLGLTSLGLAGFLALFSL